MKKGRIVIISGPSGSGKTTLQAKLLKSKRVKGKLVESISITTRPRRKGEKDGREYFFVSDKMFRYKKRAGHLLESEQVFHCFYGTPRKYVYDLLKKGTHVLLGIDVKGARKVRLQYPEALMIFIKTPSLKVLKERLLKRKTEEPTDLKIRVAIASQELKAANRYDFVIINNDLKKAYAELENIVCRELFAKR
ncbi:MAG: guanylate kinase [Candidatus Omnitrophica bacterium]|nr:guanylate kinase [Candidatus Omnitrophota bacterium]